MWQLLCGRLEDGGGVYVEGCVSALVGEMSEERKALVRKVGKEGQRKAERGREREEREGGRKKGSEGEERGSNYPNVQIFYPRCSRS